MAEQSKMLSLGTQAPDFELPDPSGRVYSLDDFSSADGLLVAFICNHCPYVKHIQSEFADFARKYEKKGLAVVAINANDVERYPDDRPERMAEVSEEVGYTFPYLFDESQEVAREFRAACTPEFYLFDEDRELVYRGRFDASRPGSDKPVTGDDLRAAADALLEGDEVPDVQIPSMGCGIKWKPGNAPND